MRSPEDPTRDPASEARDDHASEPRATPETDAGWHPPFSYDIDEDGAYEVAVLANPKHTQGAWVKIEDYRRLQRQRDELLEAVESLLQHRPRADWEGLTIAEGLTWDDAEDLIAAVKGGKP